MRYALLGGWLAFAQIVSACPMCASGGPADYVKFDEPQEIVTIRKLKRWSVGMDARTISSTEGIDDDSRHRQTQFALNLAYRATSNLFLMARVPYSRTDLQEADESKFVCDGVGDAEVLGAYEFKSEGARWWPGVSVGLKVPTGDNDAHAEDAQVSSSSLDHGHSLDGRLDEHGQVGTGAMDAMIMGHVRRSGVYRISSTIGYRINGENDYEYRYGNLTWFDFVVSRAVTKSFSAGLGTRLRHGERNTDRRVEELHSGGTILALMPEFGYGFGSSLKLSAMCSVPIVNELNGQQSEELGLTVALTQSF